MSKKLLSLAFASLLTVGAASTAQADTILVFGQTAGTDFIGTDNGNGTTTISATNVVVDLTQFFDGNTYDDVFFNFTATSTGPATQPGSQIEQNYAGTFSFTSLANGGGTNYLSGVFSDLLAGFGSAASLQATTAGGDFVTFTSDFGILFPNLGISLSLISVSPNLHISNAGNSPTIGSFTSAVSGVFEADDFERDTPVPEPASMILLGTGLLGSAGLARLRRRKNSR